VHDQLIDNAASACEERICGQFWVENSITRFSAIVASEIS